MDKTLKSQAVDMAMKVIVVLIGASVLAFASLPSRVKVLETQQDDIKSSIKSMDSKLDTLLQRVK